MHTLLCARRCLVVLLLLVTPLAGCTTAVIPRPAARLGPGVYQGTGFLVRPDGLVLTAYHVVEEGNTIKVRCQGCDLVPASLGEHSRTMDVAVLHTGLTGTPYLPAAEPRSVQPGDPVFSMGFPSASYLGTDPKYFSGAIGFMHDNGARPQNLNWAVKMECATPLYDRPGGPSPRGGARTPGEVAEPAARAVCMVLAGP